MTIAYPRSNVWQNTKHMGKLVPKVWVLEPWDDQDSRYFKGICPDLDQKGKLKADVVAEIMPLATHPFHNGPHIERPTWYEGTEISYSPRRLFFDHLGFVLKRKRDQYSYTVLRALFGVTEKHPDAKTLAIIFPDEAVFEDDDAESIVHTIQKSFVMDCQTPKGRPDEKLSHIESVYLIVPRQETTAKQLLEALERAQQPA